jgi:hypothetical protein
LVATVGSSARAFSALEIELRDPPGAQRGGPQNTLGIILNRGKQVALAPAAVFAQKDGRRKNGRR